MLVLPYIRPYIGMYACVPCVRGRACNTFVHASGQREHGSLNVGHVIVSESTMTVTVPMTRIVTMTITVTVTNRDRDRDRDRAHDQDHDRDLSVINNDCDRDCDRDCDN